VAEAAPVAAAPTAVDDLALTDAQKAAIVEAGYDSREKLTAATDEQLHAIPGIGDASIQKIRDLYPAA
jgi:DNA uptake protein ComE-like DNA-binding protein